MIIFILSALMASAEPAKDTSMKNPVWFTNKDCKSLEIKKSKSMAKHATIVGHALITDKNYIQKIMTKLESLPSDGPEMVKPGPDAELTELFFQCADGVRRIRMISQMIQTPGTGFNVGEVKLPAEKEVVADMMALTQPDLKKRIPKVVDLELKFKDFSITFKGSEDKKDEHASLSLTKDTYKIKAAGKEQILTVLWTQNPPQPKEFHAGKTQYTLLSFTANQTDEDLYPNHFKIIK